ncbi:uncharacterized protein [Miscanthus floridulus]|uniref:uncharacterized protein n=1 Tax=Miscanthus floridulus TaxID=154761 RepID=UPI00345A61F8
MVYGDSALVINQINKDWSCTSEKMDAYCAEIRKLEVKFYGLEFHHVVQDENQAADRLSKIGSTRAQVPVGVFVQDLRTPSIKPGQEVEEMLPTEQLVLVVPGPSIDWRELFIKYLTIAEVPTNKIGAERLIPRSKNYVLVDGKLMRKNAKKELLQKCISQEEGMRILNEIHAGSCDNHVASRSLVDKAFRGGFYWPSAVADAESLV